MTNDGRIPGGPTSREVQDVRTTHVSTLVYNRQHFDYAEERVREHSRWRSERGRRGIIWQLTPRQTELVEAHGFHYINSVRLLYHDRALLLALAERWWPIRHCFQFSFGEMTVILEDTAQLLGLPIDGEPVVMDEDLDAGDLIREYLGIEPPEDLNAKSMVKYTWLRANFINPSQTATHEVEANEERLVCCTRAYLVSLCGSILFSTAKGNEVNIRFLSLFHDLTSPTPYAWGAATLAHLYHALDSFVKVTSSMVVSANLGGCVTLLQVWAYERFPNIGRPLSRVEIHEVFSVARRWMVENIDPAFGVPGILSAYRPSFETVGVYDVCWLPYPTPPVGAPAIQATAKAMSLHTYYVIYQHVAMYHPADRVLRQFGLFQGIPNEPLIYVRNKANLGLRMARLRDGWLNRFTRYGVQQTVALREIEDFAGTLEYRNWWGAPRLMHPRYEYMEPRYTPMSRDDASLRDTCIRVDDVLPTFDDAMHNPNMDLRRVVEDSVNILRGRPMAPIPPRFVGTDVSVVRPRVPRQRRYRGTSSQGASTSAAVGTPDEETDLFDPAVLDQVLDHPYSSPAGTQGAQHTQIPLTPSFPSSSQHATQPETDEADEQLNDDDEENGFERRPRRGLRRIQRVDYARFNSPTCYTDEHGRGCHPHRRGGI